MEITTATAGQLSTGELKEMARYRYGIFVEQLGWQLECSPGIELDQFDRNDTNYVIARSTSGQMIGAARLLPTTRPYLLGDVFPQLMDHSPPRDAQTWELSRFAVDPPAEHAGISRSRFSSPVAIELLKASLRLAQTKGADRLVTVSPVGVERLLRREGFNASRAGEPCLVSGQMLFACWIHGRCKPDQQQEMPNARLEELVAAP